MWPRGPCNSPGAPLEPPSGRPSRDPACGRVTLNERPAATCRRPVSLGPDLRPQPAGRPAAGRPPAPHPSAARSTAGKRASTPR
ncbi:MAG: hypothetical protein FJZ97_08710 [Chloroflexi bacterium]|nr:hypothetical protein [Chloroflexota bacterium]